MGTREYSRRDLLKSAGAGALGLGVGVALFERMGRYLVGVTGSDAGAAAASVSESAHARIDLAEYTGLTLVSGVYSPDRREALRSREDVAFVQRDWPLQHVSAARATGDGQTLPWGVDRVGAAVAHAEGETGAGVNVAVVDSGIDHTHPDLTENLAGPGSTENHESWVGCEGGCEHPWSDDGGHGTHVAATIAAADGDDGVVGVAPEATLHALKVCAADGSCRTSDLIEAIRYAADHGLDVVNLSLGSPQESPALRVAGQYALEAGLLPVAAAGNRGRPDSVSYPAAYDEFLAVSATNIDDEVAAFSSTGPEVDLAAPGVGVCSAVVDGYGLQDGTSMAAPHVTGAAAQLIAAGYAHTEARARLLETAEDLGKPTDEQGAGLVDVAGALGYESTGGTGDGTSCPR